MFTEQPIAITVTKKLAGITTDDVITDNFILVDILESSRSLISGYRVYIAAAMWIWTISSSQRGQIVSADGVTWLKPEEIASSINGLLTLQEAQDASLTDIPTGWGINTIRLQICGCASGNENYIPIFGAMIV